ncbi:MAG: hypothetical protein MJ184_12260, partial [Treponema sp.]
KIEKILVDGDNLEYVFYDGHIVCGKYIKPKKIIPETTEETRRKVSEGLKRSWTEERKKEASEKMKAAWRIINGKSDNKDTGDN